MKKLEERLLAFDPKDRPSAEEALADPYFQGLANVDQEPSTQAISKLEFEFERRKLNKDDVRELIYREILEYHPKMLEEYLHGGEQISFMYPSGVDRFKRQFAHLEENYCKGEKSTLLQRQHASLPRERIYVPKDKVPDHNKDFEKSVDFVAQTSVQSPPRSNQSNGPKCELDIQADLNNPNWRSCNFHKSASISASKAVADKTRKDIKDEMIPNHVDEQVDGLSHKMSELYA